MTSTERHIIGAMTGTSIDGLDLALVRIHGSGLSMRAELLDHLDLPLGPLVEPLRNAANQTPMPARDFADLARALGTLHAEGVREIAGRNPSAEIDLVVAHGQTILHDPPLTWQLLDPSPIVTAIGARFLPVLTDLRRSDIEAGGEGAPITPLADWIMFRSPDERRAIINLGGFCNITSLPADDGRSGIDAIIGRDVCACNHLLDGLARQFLNQPYDEHGHTAAAGTVDRPTADALCKTLLDQAAAGRSLGTGDEPLGELLRSVSDIESDRSPADLLATAADALAQAIMASVTNAGRTAETIYLAGGGCRNAHLVARLRAHAPCSVETIDALGVPAEAREAAAMAVLGALRLDGEAITLSKITGSGAPLRPAGSLTGPVPGRDDRPI